MNKYSVRFLLIFIALLLFAVFTVGKATCQVATPTEVKNDGRPLTLGIVFQPHSQSVVTGLRMYRGWDGQVTGQLWSQTGRLMAVTSFPDGAHGWQTAYFLTPVQISPDSGYVATYHSTSGFYGAQEGYFPKSFANWEAIDSRYAYFDVPVFPAGTYNGTNYGIEPIIGVEEPTGPGETVVIYIRDTMRIVLRDTITIRMTDTITQVVYMEGRDTITVDRSPNYTDSALRTWPMQGIWNYEFSVGAEKYRFIRTFVWRRQKWDGTKWNEDDIQ